MAKGISIGIAGDASEFASAVKKGVIEPLEDADDAVKDIGRDASRLDELESNMTAAQKATSKYERELQDAIDAQKKAARGARDIGDDAQHGFKDAGHYSGEFKDEALANFSEVTSSFDGSMTSVVDLAQGTFGGLASLGGPIGIAAGGIAAILGGAFSAMATSADEKAKETEERISKMYDSLLESGKNYLTEEQVGQAISDIGNDTEKFTKAQQDAKTSGIDLSLILRAQAGDAAALASVQATVADKYAAAKEEADKYLSAKGPQAQAAAQERNDMQALVDQYTGYGSASSEAVKKAEAIRQAFADLGLQSDGTAKQVDNVTNSVNNVPAGKTITVTVDDAAARERLRQLGKAINVDMYVTPRTGFGVG